MIRDAELTRFDRGMLAGAAAIGDEVAKLAERIAKRNDQLSTWLHSAEGALQCWENRARCAEERARYLGWLAVVAGAIGVALGWWARGAR